VSNVEGQQKSSDELTADYLAALAKHLIYTLEQKVGKVILQSIPIDFCLTVPAIWSEVAKEKTLKACEKAGLKPDAEILLVSEPVSWKPSRGGNPPENFNRKLLQYMRSTVLTLMVSTLETALFSAMLVVGLSI
jgi:hypothetical protein